MDSVRLYPGGVVVGINSKKNDLNKRLIITKPDAGITELYKEQQTTFLNPESFEFKKRLFEHMYRLYGKSLSLFLRQQLLDNKFIHGSNQEFLIDTLRYIITGVRTVNISSWLGLLSFYPDSTPHKQKIHDEDVLGLLNILRNHNTEELLVMWSTKPDGFYDMLYTTYLLFGNASNITFKNT